MSFPKTFFLIGIVILIIVLAWAFSLPSTTPLILQLTVTPQVLIPTPLPSEGVLQAAPPSVYDNFGIVDTEYSPESASDGRGSDSIKGGRNAGIGGKVSEGADRDVPIELDSRKP